MDGGREGVIATALTAVAHGAQRDRGSRHFLGGRACRSCIIMLVLVLLPAAAMVVRPPGTAAATCARVSELKSSRHPDTCCAWPTYFNLTGGTYP